MLARMIAYCIDMNVNKFRNVLGVGFRGTKWRMMMSVVLMKTQRAHQQRCCGIFLSFQGLSVCLLMETTQNTWHGMQMGETVMECFIIQLIPRSGKRLIICIQILAKRQEILGLATDGMNPYDSLRTQHSSWLVLLVIYNFPPWSCMKWKYMMLSMMISGLRQSRNDIDVYLSPLIEDLSKLWDERVLVFDGFQNETFHLCAMLFCTCHTLISSGDYCLMACNL